MKLRVIRFRQLIRWSMIFSDDVSGVSETALDIDKEQFGENKAVVDSGADSDFKKELDISEE